MNFNDEKGNECKALQSKYFLKKKKNYFLTSFLVRGDVLIVTCDYDLYSGRYLKRKYLANGL